MNFENRTWLITGGTGSLGEQVVRRILKEYSPKEVRVFSRTENKQVSLKRELQDGRLKFIIGDIRSKASVKRAVYGVDFIVHTAAMKHVPICEEFVYECIWTNIIGTENLIEASLSENIERFIAISTDKASDPGNTYGFSKALLEKLIIGSNRNKGNRKTIFSAARFGNIAGSAGSVIELFRRQVSQKKDITVTNPSMTRFFIDLDEAVDTVMFALENCQHGEVFIPKMFSLKIENLAKAILEISENKKLKMKTIGARQGEKVHESIISEEESERTIQHGKYYVILPSVQKFHIPKKKISSTNVKEMSMESISEMLRKI